MTRCPACGAEHEDGTLDLARTRDMPDGIDVLVLVIAIWLRCPCGNALAEVYDRATGSRIDCDATPLAEGGLVLTATAA